MHPYQYPISDTGAACGEARPHPLSLVRRLARHPAPSPADDTGEGALVLVTLLSAPGGRELVATARVVLVRWAVEIRRALGDHTTGGGPFRVRRRIAGRVAPTRKVTATTTAAPI